MGYTTYFSGEFKTNKPLKENLIREINEFSSKRHCSYDNVNDSSGFPGLWCQWIVRGDSTIVWDEGEKFYNYVDWLLYIIQKFLNPNDIKISGDVQWQGEDSDDFGVIRCIGNTVYTMQGVRDYLPPVEVRLNKDWRY